MKRDNKVMLYEQSGYRKQNRKVKIRKKEVTLLLVVTVILIIVLITNNKNLTVDTLLIDTSLYEDWDKLVLVNNKNPLYTGEAPTDLVELNGMVPVNDNRQYLVKRELTDRLNDLLESFHEINPHADVRVTSAYRSYEYQKHLYESYEEHERQGLVATPGCSEHQTGLAIDIAEVGIRSSQLHNTEFYKYLENHAHEYGFIIRYPKNKQWLTGVIFEPWHLRYVGKKYAIKIFNSGLTFEEYWDYIYNRIHTV